MHSEIGRANEPLKFESLTETRFNSVVKKISIAASDLFLNLLASKLKWAHFLHKRPFFKRQNVPKMFDDFFLLSLSRLNRGQTTLAESRKPGPSFQLYGCRITKRPSLELQLRPKQRHGSLPLDNSFPPSLNDY